MLLRKDNNNDKLNQNKRGLKQNCTKLLTKLKNAYNNNLNYWNYLKKLNERG